MPIASLLPSSTEIVCALGLADQLVARSHECDYPQSVGENHVYVSDGNQYFNRPGPRLAELLEILAEILHPDVFHFGHEGEGWMRWWGD